MSLHEDRRSSFKISAVWTMFSCVLVIVRLLLLYSSRIDSYPPENVLYQRNTIARYTADSPYTFWIISNVFVALKPAFQQKRIAACCSVVFSITIYDTDKTDKLHRIAIMYLTEWFELKLGMRGEEGLLTNFPKFHGDRATSTMFSQCCHKTKKTDLVANCKYNEDGTSYSICHQLWIAKCVQVFVHKEGNTTRYSCIHSEIKCVYSRDIMFIEMVRQWMKKFWEARQTDVHDMPQSSQPSDIVNVHVIVDSDCNTISNIKNLVRDNDLLEISHGSTFMVLHNELVMSKFCAQCSACSNS